MKNFFYVLIIIIATTSCGGIGGDRSFGNNLKLVEGNKEEDRAIIYCADANKPCSEGIYVIPTKDRHATEYVDEVRSNHDWVIARTIDKDKKENYWIVNMDFTVGDQDCKTADCGEYVKNFVTGPLTLEDFNGARKEFGIALEIPKKK